MLGSAFEDSPASLQEQGVVSRQAFTLEARHIAFLARTLLLLVCENRDNGLTRTSPSLRLDVHQEKDMIVVA